MDGGGPGKSRTGSSVPFLMKHAQALVPCARSNAMKDPLFLTLPSTVSGGRPDFNACHDLSGWRRYTAGPTVRQSPLMAVLPNSVARLDSAQDNLAGSNVASEVPSVVEATATSRP